LGKTTSIVCWLDPRFEWSNPTTLDGFPIKHFDYFALSRCFPWPLAR
jgi:hypothetical protein